MTNQEHIKATYGHELPYYLSCKHCIYHNPNEEYCDKSCKAGIEKWLDSEYKEELSLS
jgi:hypothetical protein